MDNPEAHIFVVEDDAAMRQMVCEYLSKQSMTVTPMGSAEELLRRIHKLRPDLVLLDVSLPGNSGLQACQALRAEGDRIPIILLTARTEEYDRVMGLEIGADDYIGKPFSPRELLARIRAVLRRAQVVPGTGQALGSDVALGDVVFQVASRRLVWSNGEQRALTTVEYALLCELVGNPQVPLSRERLLNVAHGRANALLPRTVDVAIMRLRKIVEPDAAKPRYIQSVRNFGYVFVPDTTSA
jgi:two-component system, OmpR family, phosphate regulon response regulator OmpR